METKEFDTYKVSKFAKIAFERSIEELIKLESYSKIFYAFNKL